MGYFTKCVNQIAPLNELWKVPEKEPWVTSDLLRLLRERDLAQQDFLYLVGTMDKNLLQQKIKIYHELRNRAKREVMKCKRNFVKNNVSMLDNSSTTFWSEFHKIAPIGKKTPDCCSNTTITLSNDNNELIEGNDVSDYMNNYFISIGKDLANKINLDNSAYIDMIGTEPVITLENWDTVSEAETLLLVQGIDIHKSSNIDELNSLLLKDCLLSSIDKLTHLFYSVLCTNLYPDCWKLGTVVPLFKSGKKQKVNNFRPVCLLPVIGKLMEKIMHRRLLIFLDTKKFFSDSQGGFRPNMSTTDTIAKLLTYVYDNLNNNIPVVTIYYDLRKAFDTIDHSILIAKLKGAGLKGTCLNLLINYLTNRKQRCRANNYLSSYKGVSYGVLQGSTLGPLLFIIYMNDVVKFVDDIGVTLYADDTAFYFGNKDPAFINSTLTTAAEGFQYWCSLNRLTLNIDKCKSMIFNM